VVIAKPELWFEGEAKWYGASLTLQLRDEALVADFAICHVNSSRSSLIFRQDTYGEPLKLRI
jgi:hypothetical protein